VGSARVEVAPTVENVGDRLGGEWWAKAVASLGTRAKAPPSGRIWIMADGGEALAVLDEGVDEIVGNSCRQGGAHAVRVPGERCLGGEVEQRRVEHPVDDVGQRGGSLRSGATTRSPSPGSPA
jgi:hypothetical protein